MVLCKDERTRSAHPPSPVLLWARLRWWYSYLEALPPLVDARRGNRGVCRGVYGAEDQDITRAHGGTNTLQTRSVGDVHNVDVDGGAAAGMGRDQRGGLLQGARGPSEEDQAGSASMCEREGCLSADAGALNRNQWNVRYSISVLVGGKRDSRDLRLP